MSYAAQRGIAQAHLPMEASELDRHINYCDGVRAAVDELTASTLEDMKMHADHLRDVGVDPPFVKPRAIGQDTDVLSRRSSESGGSDREQAECWRCCKSETGGRLKHKAKKKISQRKKRSYGAAVHL